MANELPSANPPFRPEKAEVLLPDAIRQIIEGTSLPPKEKQRIAIQMASFFSGPLPHPNTLKEYDQIVQNGAERIFAKFEAQTNHRIQLENFAVREQLGQSSRGQIFGFIISILGLGLSVVLAIFGHEILASTIGGSTLIGLVTVFVVGRGSVKKNIESKQ